MKNLVFIGILIFSFNLRAQSSLQPELISLNGKILYKKSCQSNVVTGPIKCILCSDKKLKTNCKSYTKDSKGIYKLDQKSMANTTTIKSKKPTKPIKGDPDDGGEVTKK